MGGQPRLARRFIVRILIIGRGGREHALAWKLSQSPKVTEIFIAPGNGGTGDYGRNVPIKDSDIAGLVAFAREQGIDLVVPGPELPLVLGVTDAMQAAGIACFGPSAYAAQLEGSKAFAKEIMVAGGVPTAEFAEFTDLAAARAYVREKGAPLVVKADGLAAGKGVIVAKTESEALAALDEIMGKKVFGAAGEKVIVEEALVGEEASLLAFCDGEDVLPLPSAQDHKAVFDGDTGPNTGGMGAYSPAPILPERRYGEIVDTVIRPVLKTLEKRGCPFSGILYAGLMMTSDGPKVLEFNVRFGDPECQPLLMRLEGDLLDVMLACAQGRLHEASLSFTPMTSLCVVLTAKGYPGSYPTGMTISGIRQAEESRPGLIKVFQAGTRPAGESPQSSGGRVLGITALGADLAEAQKNAYEALAHIRMENSHFRRDIGSKGLKSCWACSR